ncbi:mechanosensitive ion channel family protein [Aureimonas leprariae]|uniref:Mechanosensitive ion channel family protein n=1 Tax=Plantimonas leprariae TaxID=2615207 RepID=A0A7V7PN75_9HYPH|nr:mechanosensitive ion channel family protein [Aureimonas leprariae]KAB0679020.1 mechanosensitive ion channel family protein [Aureimonas leprariae]
MKSLADMPTATMSALDAVSSRAATLANAVAGAAPQFRTVETDLVHTLASGSGVRAVTYLLVILSVGVALEAYHRVYAATGLRILAATTPSSPRQALLFALRKALLKGFGVALFALGAIGTSAAFAWPPGVHAVVVSATLGVVAVRLAALAADALFAPNRASLRLVPLADGAARLAVFAGVLLAVFLTSAWLVPPLLAGPEAAPLAAEAVRLVAGSLAAVLSIIVATALPAPTDHRRRAPQHRGRLPQFPRAVLAVALIVATYALWLFGGGGAALVLAALGGLVFLQGAMRRIVFHFWRDVMPTDVSDSADEPPPLAPLLVLPAARLVAILIALVLCALATDMSLAGMAKAEDPLARFAVRLLGVAALVLVADVAWIAVRSAIDHQLARIGAATEAGTLLGSQSRLLTLLPLLRTTAMVLILVLLALSSLWTLGIEITPLLAGAGIVGLAFGFGAQSLVKDVISGLFFLAEDVFRIGEYIESGSSTKGTVERITLRTVALRHHNGPLHFVPYGSLSTVRNMSRDWVVEKFDLPLPIETDSEKVRKLLKRVGEEMLEDEEVGPKIIEPLKGKLQRIEPGLKVFRCKFRTAPGNQFDVRALAFRKIETALRDADIAYADTTARRPVALPATAAANAP